MEKLFKEAQVEALSDMQVYENFINYIILTSLNKDEMNADVITNVTDLFANAFMMSEMFKIILSKIDELDDGELRAIINYFKAASKFQVVEDFETEGETA